MGRIWHHSSFDPCPSRWPWHAMAAEAMSIDAFCMHKASFDCAFSAGALCSLQFGTDVGDELWQASRRLRFDTVCGPFSSDKLGLRMFGWEAGAQLLSNLRFSPPGSSVVAVYPLKVWHWTIRTRSSHVNCWKGPGEGLLPLGREVQNKKQSAMTMLKD